MLKNIFEIKLLERLLRIKRCRYQKRKSQYLLFAFSSFPDCRLVVEHQLFKVDLHYLCRLYLCFIVGNCKGICWRIFCTVSDCLQICQNYQTKCEQAWQVERALRILFMLSTARSRACRFRKVGFLQLMGVYLAHYKRNLFMKLGYYIYQF